MAGYEVDGTNLEECLATIQSAVRAAREGGGPQLVVGRLLRLCGHGEHDDGSYVPSDLRESELGSDCLEIGISQIVARGLASEEEIKQWQMEAAEEVQNAVAISQKEAGPDPYQEDWQAVDLVVSERVGPAATAGPRCIMHLGYMYPIRRRRSLDRM